jgi:hypothetical protein
MTFWDFWNEHWFLAFFALYFSAEGIVSLVKYIVILIRGWPPEEL